VASDKFRASVTWEKITGNPHAHLFKKIPQYTAKKALTIQYIVIHYPPNFLELLNHLMEVFYGRSKYKKDGA
jgi:hypothetical protein